MKNKGTMFVPGRVTEWLDCGNKDATVFTNQRYLEYLKERGESLVADVGQNHQLGDYRASVHWRERRDYQLGGGAARVAWATNAGGAQTRAWPTPSCRRPASRAPRRRGQLHDWQQRQRRPASRPT
ncbi:MAG: hypothetical protein WKG07_15380 [Hymenobacter sp.]